MGRGPEGRLGGGGVTLRPGAGEVARRLRPDLRRAGCARLCGVDHRGQLGVVHAHQVRCVARGRLGLGHDHGHRLADMAHAVLGQHRVGRIAGGAAVRKLQRDEGIGDAGQRAEPVRRHVRAGIDGEHAGRGRRLRRLDRPDVRVGVGRAHEAGVHLALQRNVVLKAPPALEQGVVFLAPRRLADAEACHRSLRSSPAAMIGDSAAGVIRDDRGPGRPGAIRACRRRPHAAKWRASMLPSPASGRRPAHPLVRGGSDDV